jgi:hypothetical protein
VCSVRMNTSMGTPPSILQEYGNTAFYAASDGPVEIYGHWCENPPLRSAAGCESVVTVRVHVEMGTDVHARAADGRTPLHWAAGNGDVKTVRVLAEMGADVNARAANGYTSLHWAADEGHVNTVRMLVNIGDDVLAQADVGENGGCTPLHLAALKGYVRGNSKGVGGEWGQLACTDGPEITPESHRNHTATGSCCERARGNSKGAGGDGDQRECMGCRWMHTATLGCCKGELRICKGTRGDGGRRAYTEECRWKHTATSSSCWWARRNSNVAGWVIVRHAAWSNTGEPFF